VLRWVIVCVALMASGGTARAHLASDSYLRIEIGQSGAVGGQWDIALRDLDVAVGLDANQDGAITWGELRVKTQDVEAYAFGHLTLARGGAACRLVPTVLMVDYHAGIAYAVMPFTAECSAAGLLTLQYRLLFDLDPTHRGLLTIVQGERISSEVLSPEHAELSLDDGAAESPTKQVAQFLLFGFDHILLGYDHLLFIAVLLVTAAMHRGIGDKWVPIDHLGRVLIDTIKTLTAFTLAHATVLTPALLWSINAPAQLVEPAVAATIILAGVDNFWSILPRLRWQVAFTFGLIHGLSFASTLGPMRLPPLSLGLALASFNFGVEAGQIAVALLLVPIAFSVRHEVVYRSIIAPAISMSAVLLAGVWLVDRVFALDLLSFQPAAMATITR
jgi:HupE / UreJ protein